MNLPDPVRSAVTVSVGAGETVTLTVNVGTVTNNVGTVGLLMLATGTTRRRNNRRRGRIGQQPPLSDYHQTVSK